jgi:hypothetical protein
LDAAYQLKLLVKGYYEKRSKMKADLIASLDHMITERPNTI